MKLQPFYFAVLSYLLSVSAKISISSAQADSQQPLQKNGAQASRRDVVINAPRLAVPLRSSALSSSPSSFSTSRKRPSRNRVATSLETASRLLGTAGALMFGANTFNKMLGIVLNRQIEFIQKFPFLQILSTHQVSERNAYNASAVKEMREDQEELWRLTNRIYSDFEEKFGKIEYAIHSLNSTLKNNSVNIQDLSERVVLVDSLIASLGSIKNDVASYTEASLADCKKNLTIHFDAEALRLSSIVQDLQVSIPAVMKKRDDEIGRKLEEIKSIIIQQREQQASPPNTKVRPPQPPKKEQ